MEATQFKRKYENGKEYIFDRNRKKFVVLTAEEWVRQQVLDYLMRVLYYPPSVISVERQIRVGNLKRRYDIVVFYAAQPWLIIECKSEFENLNEVVLGQILAYNSSLQVKFLTVTNGHDVMTYQIGKQTWKAGFPPYPNDALADVEIK